MKFLGKFCFYLLCTISSNLSIADTIARSDILLHIATQCVDPFAVNYCSRCTLPRVDIDCGQEFSCKKTNDVWELTSHFIAMRDIKMCGCPTGFIHGLAMPREVVAGVEDLSRPEEIWPFAWSVGMERMEENSLALVVNPQSQRSQNQLHVHIVRLSQNARQQFTQYSFAIVGDINQVWKVAESIALSGGLSDYGVLVSRYSTNQFIVVISKDSPEELFT